MVQMVGRLRMPLPPSVVQMVGRLRMPVVGASPELPGGGAPEFDLMLIGMGADGHVGRCGLGGVGKGFGGAVDSAHISHSALLPSTVYTLESRRP